MYRESASLDWVRKERAIGKGEERGEEERLIGSTVLQENETRKSHPILMINYSGTYTRINP